MLIRQMPGLRRGLVRVQGIVVALGPKHIHGLRPGDTRVLGQGPGHVLGQLPVRHRDHEAVQSQQRHRPVGDERQPMLACQRGRHAATRAVCRSVAVAA